MLGRSFVGLVSYIHERTVECLSCAFLSSISFVCVYVRRVERGKGVGRCYMDGALVVQ